MHEAEIKGGILRYRRTPPDDATAKPHIASRPHKVEVNMLNVLLRTKRLNFSDLWKGEFLANYIDFLLSKHS